MERAEIREKLEEFEKKDPVLAKTKNFIVQKRNKQVDFKLKEDFNDRYHIISHPFFLFWEEEIEETISDMIQQLECLKEQIKSEH